MHVTVPHQMSKYATAEKRFGNESNLRCEVFFLIRSSHILTCPKVGGYARSSSRQLIETPEFYSAPRHTREEQVRAMHTREEQVRAIR